MQELLFNSYLAYNTGRHFAFDNYTWNRDGSDYTDYNGKLIPSRIPNTALIRGPAVGDPFPPGDNASLAVVKEYFDKVCPEPTVISSDVVGKTLDGDASAQTVLEAWVAKLRAMDDHPCIEIERDTQQIFSIWIFGSTRVLDIFPGFAKSPIMTLFRWSPLIESAFAVNRPVISPPTFLDKLLPSIPFLRPSTPYPMISGLLVLHIRRGDFAEHCAHLARWSSLFNGFNSFPELPDQFEPPPGAGWGENTPENTQLYMQRCFPTVEQIVEKVRDVRATRAGRGLRNVYIMTNGAKEWVDELKAALFAMGGLERVTGSRDVLLNWEQKYVAQAVDMLIGQRAQVLIGNGFSSLTSNIVMMRMANGFAPDSNRFW
ncbi:uncharacterized protein C8Q71DRAFT_367854 [Rhodofomes roseus]|uniref:Uncharacterized protein n=1 Tax=Rhodofomes roseus TaxID=34475 RepID=A0ABQ8K1A6_9APHY|nr:uncharacterized protein C8Q71DRAFT_367854 [Rhodofomes roseus]KAH9830479.1 hypothetical protein C8Q71DRAFT_367854 [Rhodofomes roseus]